MVSAYRPSFLELYLMCSLINSFLKQTILIIFKKNDEILTFVVNIFTIRLENLKPTGDKNEWTKIKLV